MGDGVAGVALTPVEVCAAGSGWLELSRVWNRRIARSEITRIANSAMTGRRTRRLGAGSMLASTVLVGARSGGAGARFGEAAGAGAAALALAGVRVAGCEATTPAVNGVGADGCEGAVSAAAGSNATGCGAMPADACASSDGCEAAIPSAPGSNQADCEPAASKVAGSKARGAGVLASAGTGPSGTSGSGAEAAVAAESGAWCVMTWRSSTVGRAAGSRLRQRLTICAYSTGKGA